MICMAYYHLSVAIEHPKRWKNCTESGKIVVQVIDQFLFWENSIKLTTETGAESQEDSWIVSDLHVSTVAINNCRQLLMHLTWSGNPTKHGIW